MRQTVRAVKHAVFSRQEHNSIRYWYLNVATCFDLSIDHIQTNVHRFVCFHGRPWQATDVPQPSWLFVPPALDVQTLATRCDASAPTDASRTIAAEVGTYGRGMRTGKFSLNADFHGTF
jgi:hypothetical protein